MHECESVLFLVFLQMLTPPIRIEIPKKMALIDEMHVVHKYLEDEDVACDQVRKHYDQIGFDDDLVNPISMVVNSVYCGACTGADFKHKPLILTSYYRLNIRRTIFRAILFAIDHQVAGLTIHLFSDNDVTHASCEKLIRTFIGLRKVGSNMNYHDDMEPIIEFFGLNDYPYIPMKFCMYLYKVNMTVVDVAKPECESMWRD